MAAEAGNRPDEAFVRNAINSSLRIGVLLLLIVYCLRIVGPFINITLWGIIIGVALYPAHVKLARLLGNSQKASAALIVLIALAVLIIPISLMSESGIASAKSLSGQLQAGELSIPPPSEKVADWPVIGDRLHAAWSGAASNLEATINQFQPQLVAAGQWLLKALGSAAGGVLAFMASLIVAGFFLVSAEVCYRWTVKLMTELTGDRGKSLTDLCVQTIRSVAKGVVGVAIIQTLLAAVGLIAMKVPATGIWLALILLIAVLQIPTAIVILPIVIWVYSIAEPGPATLFAVWMVFVSLSDNVLKPLLLGRGVKIPTLVILVGAIGGAIYAGFIGLFLGAVVLALGYELLLAWMNPDTVEETLAEIAEEQ